ncbi:MAG: STELLO glycosyltransferase family protein [Desulfobacterales bacterium]
MKTAVVITTIFQPTDTVRRLAGSGAFDILVVGDRRTPPDWQWPGVRYISVEEQEASRFRVIQRLPWNHYSRKIAGYLEAIRGGAQVIAETDDDNLPENGWGFPSFSGRFDTVPADSGFVNIYRLFTAQKIWPRGLPLSRVSAPDAVPPRILPGQSHRIGIWQGLADGDPDVDAIYRLTGGSGCRFERRPPVVMDTGTLSPLNSQNTAFCKAAFALLYLPATVNFRVTDILRGYVAQPILWAAGLRAGVTGPTVFQERNDHDLLKDFESELPIYLNAEAYVEAVLAAVGSGRSIEDNLFNAYDALAGRGWVVRKEMEILSAWLEDLEALKGSESGEKDCPNRNRDRYRDRDRNGQEAGHKKFEN